MSIPESADPKPSFLEWACNPALGLISPPDRPWYVAEQPVAEFVGKLLPVWCPCQRMPVQLCWFEAVDGSIWIGQCRFCEAIIWTWLMHG